jgi:protein-L-isoaspartate(D-aspartate) O-methyltransferase
VAIRTGLTFLTTAVLLASAATAALATARESSTTDMSRMIQAIKDDARLTASYTGRPTLSGHVLKAMASVDREDFVPENMGAHAYENVPLSIGHGQTISQPFIVALMTDLLEPEAGDRILEIGTGSGYQAAILAGLVDEVYTVEIIPELAEDAAARLTGLGYDNVHVKTGDGWHGWPEAGPYDGIIVTAVDEDVPPRLVEQLAPGGRLVLPLGPRHGRQMLVVMTRDESSGELVREDVLPVQFVPLTGEH